MHSSSTTKLIGLAVSWKKLDSASRRPIFFQLTARPINLCSGLETSNFIRKSYFVRYTQKHPILEHPFVNDPTQSVLLMKDFHNGRIKWPWGHYAFDFTQKVTGKYLKQYFKKTSSFLLICPTTWREKGVGAYYRPRFLRLAVHVGSATE